jgi:hypothetical protein
MTSTIQIQGENVMRHMIRIFVFALIAALVALPALAQQDVISTVIGGGPGGNVPATDANLYGPVSVAFDSAGNYYIASYYQNRVFKVNTSGLLTLIAGNGLAGYSGDGVTGGAANAELNGPYSVAVDSSDNVYIADYSNFVIRKVNTTTNTITTFLGTQGTCGGSTSTLCYPEGVAVDSTSTNLFIADSNDCQIKKVVLATNAVSVFAGSDTETCGYTGNGGNATAAELSYPAAVAVDSSEDVFIADTNNYVIREVTASNGHIILVAGDNTNGYSGDKGLATKAEISYVYGLTTNSAGTTVAIADNENQAIRQFTVGGDINTVAGGNGAGYGGDGGPATSANLYYPEDVTLSSSGAYYISDYDNYRVRSFTVGGDINTVAGNGSTSESTVANGVGPTGVELYYPWGVYEDPSGNIYVGDQYNQIVREFVEASDVVNTFAGTPGTAGYSGDTGAATSVELNYPLGVARDGSGNIYIADTDNCIVWIVNTAGNISIFAGALNSGGNPACGYSGDGGPATSAELEYPYGVYVDSKNNVFISDTNNHVVREVTNGTINTIAGIPNDAGYSGDGGPATAAQLYYPAAVAEDGAGNIYIADQYNHRIREINASTGNISTVAGNGACAFSGDGVAIENSLCYPTGVWADANGNFFIADQNNMRLRWVNQAGIMTTFAGSGNCQYNGDGGLATNAALCDPAGIWEDSSGDFLVTDSDNYRIRYIAAFAALNTSAGSLTFPLESVSTTSAAQQVIVSSIGPLTISNISVTGNFSESDDCPSSLPNTTTCTMYVYFTPKSSGTNLGTITFNTNGFFNSVSTINLTGTGTAISLTGAPVAFGSELKNTTSAAKTVTVKNNGSTAITMGTITLDETTDFAISSNTCPASGSTLAAKGTCAIGLTFTPTTTGAKKGAVIINDSDPTSPQIVGVTGTGTSKVVLSSTSVTLATTTVGSTSAASKITLTNETGVSVTLGNPALSVTGPFAITSSGTCTNGLVLGTTSTTDSCTIEVEFKPKAVGYASGTLSVTDSDVTSPQTAALSGTGTSIKLSPTSINFGDVTDGTQVNSTVTVTNEGTTTVNISGLDLDGANSADFSYSNGCGSSVAAGTNCAITVYFTPSIVGAEKATLKIIDSATGSPQTVALSGTGQN